MRYAQGLAVYISSERKNKGFVFGVRMQYL